jgi:arylsulfatase A-like enzyme
MRPRPALLAVFRPEGELMASFDLSRRSLLAGALAAGMPMGSASAASRLLPQSLKSGSGPKSNMILFFPDEMRADALSCYGNPVCRTPNFDALAKSGSRFENCHVENPVCVQSRCAMLTGWPTSVRGHRSLFSLLQPDEPNMFRYLKDAGYDVFWFGKNHALQSRAFTDSVTEWRASPNALSPVGLPPSIGPAGTTTMLWPSGGDRRKTEDYDLVKYAIEVLERKESDRPFCIFLPMLQPHPPYNAPADFYNMYKADEIGPLIPPNLPGKPAFHNDIREYFKLGQMSERDLRNIRAVYYGMVSYSDWLLGELMEALERTGHDKDTALFVSSDHGDYSGDYGLIEKWPSGMEDCLTHVPLIARVPGGKQGVVAPDIVELFDIMPSFLELGGTEAKHTHFARSLLPQMHGLAGDPERAAFIEGGYNVYEPQAFEPVTAGLYGAKTSLEAQKPRDVSRTAAIRTKTHKLIWRPQGDSELYDCRNDPDMRHNLINDASASSVRVALLEKLTSWYVNTSGVPNSWKDDNGLPARYPTPSINSDANRNLILDR